MHSFCREWVKKLTPKKISKNHLCSKQYTPILKVETSDVQNIFFLGTPAFAGFDAGDGVHRYVITGSCNSSIINLANETNVGKPGVWVFEIDDYIIQTPPPPSPTPPASTVSLASSLGQGTSVSTSTVITTTTQSGPSTTPGSTTSLSNADGQTF